MSAELPLQNDVATIAANVRHDPQSNNFALSDDDFALAAVIMAKPRSTAESNLIAEHLIALCLKYERLAKEHTKVAISQFMVLIAVVIGDTQKAEEALSQVGIEVNDEVASLIGTEINKLPLSSRPKEGISLFDLQLKKGKEPEDES
ncbi:hypothetical protein KAI87_07780 [Myxococcota bacterium]|nr:hypothetical protein [Myxococcota bacterium]